MKLKRREKRGSRSSSSLLFLMLHFFFSFGGLKVMLKPFKYHKSSKKEWYFFYVFVLFRQCNGSKKLNARRLSAFVRKFLFKQIGKFIFTSHLYVFIHFIQHSKSIIRKVRSFADAMTCSWIRSKKQQQEDRRKKTVEIIREQAVKTYLHACKMQFTCEQTTTTVYWLLML